MSAEPHDVPAADLVEPDTWPAPSSTLHRRSVVPPRLGVLEPLACVAVAVHGLGVLVTASTTFALEIVASAAVLLTLGALGMLGWRAPWAVATRAFAVLVLGFVLMALRQQGSGYFLLWYFVIVSVYPLVLPRRVSRLTAVVVPVAYLLLLPLDAADGPGPVALVRAVSLGLIAMFVHAAAEAYRAAVTEKDHALALLDTYADATPVGLGFWDVGLRYRRVNAALAELTGLTAAQHLGRPVRDISAATPALALNLHRVLETGQPVQDVELASGDRMWTSSYFPVRIGSTIVGIGGVVIDVTEQRHAAQALAFSATHDSLTGLPNRVLLSDRLEVALGHAARTGSDGGSGGRTVAVLFCDLDRFKLINDSLGHAAGDEILRETARRLSAVVAAGDTVARFGGDEFALLCTQVADAAEATAVAERACAIMREPMAVAGRTVISTMSVGVTVRRPGDRDVTGVLRDADLAMYRAKDAGRDRVAVFDARLRAGADQRLEFHSALRHAVESGDIQVAYQPVLALDASGRGDVPGPESVVGVEALARWHWAEHGDVSPDAFIPTAEELGLIDSLGDQVLREACVTVRRWRESTGRPLTVAVNLSVRQLVAPGYVDEVAATLADLRLPADALQLEITESVLMVDVEHSLRQLAGLRALGVRIAIDDFGTGYSSLAYLRDLPVDLLKIDQSFTRRLPGDEAMVAFIVELARAIGATTVVEGVETRAQLDAVTRLGCDQAQGFYLSRPLTGAAAARYLQRADVRPRR